MKPISIQELKLSENYSVMGNKFYNGLINILFRHWEKSKGMKKISNVIVRKIECIIPKEEQTEYAKEMLNVITYCKKNMEKDNPAILVLSEHSEMNNISELLSKYLVLQGFRIFKIPIETNKLQKKFEDEINLNNILMNNINYITNFILKLDAEKIGIIGINQGIICAKKIYDSQDSVKTFYQLETNSLSILSCIKYYKGLFNGLHEIKNHFCETLR